MYDGQSVLTPSLRGLVWLLLALFVVGVAVAAGWRTPGALSTLGGILVLVVALFVSVLCGY